MHPGWFWASNLSCRLVCKRIIFPQTVVLLLHTNKIDYDNNRLCIIVWKSVYMTKYLNVLGFFYSFVYDPPLEMCLNGNVLLWNLRDTCFLVILFLFSCDFICWVVSCYIFWAGSICHGDWWWGLSCQIPRRSWDWSLLRPWQWLKEAWKYLKSQINLLITTQALHRLLKSNLNPVLQKGKTDPRGTDPPTMILYLKLWTAVELYHAYIVFFIPLSDVVKVDLSRNLHLADGVPPQCAQTRTLVCCCRCMGSTMTPCEVPS